MEHQRAAEIRIKALGGRRILRSTEAYHEQGQNDTAQEEQEMIQDISSLHSPKACRISDSAAEGSWHCPSINFTRLCFAENTESGLSAWIWGPGPWPLDAPAETDGGVLLARHIQFLEHYATILSFLGLSKRRLYDMRQGLNVKGISLALHAAFCSSSHKFKLMFNWEISRDPV